MWGTCQNQGWNIVMLIIYTEPQIPKIKYSPTKVDFARSVTEYPNNTNTTDDDGSHIF